MTLWQNINYEPYPITMAKSNIEWTEMTWNPTTGCTKISEGCLFCYAEPLSKRLKAMGLPKYKNGFKLTLHPEELKRPFTWKKPRMVFVNSMSDLFHPEVPLKFIQAVFDVMNNTPQHKYQILTKRSERLLRVADKVVWSDNIWMGVTVENEKVTPRIKDLISVPARIKFLSCEPLLGEIKSLGKYISFIDWVIVGGESGSGARKMNKQWVEPILNICQKSGTPFFFKQWGKKSSNEDSNDPTMASNNMYHAKGGCQLEGKIYREMPVMV